MNIIIIGTGMYVCGRGTSGHGTILPAVLEYIRGGQLVNKIILVGSNGKNFPIIQQKVHSLLKVSGVSCEIDILPKNGVVDKNQYIKVLESIDKPACAIVAVPDHLHKKVAMDCLNRDFHTLVVKPLVSNLKDAKDLVSLADKKNLYAAVEFHKRFDKQNIIFRDHFNNGEIGSPVYSIVEYSQRKSIPTQIFKSWVNKTNIFQYLGVHYVDIMHFITNAIPIRVMAVGQKNWLKSKGIDVHDSIQVIVEWEMKDGTKFNQLIITSWIDPETSSAMSNQKIKLIGTKGRFTADQKNRGITFHSDDKQIENPNPDFCIPITINNQLTWQGYGIDSIKTFLFDVHKIYHNEKNLKDLEKIRPTFKEALVSTSVIEAVNMSLANDTWVSIKI